jgi:hypothetical protein
MSIGGSISGWGEGEIRRGSEGFLEDIRKNVSELEDSVDRGILVDHGFVQILLNDIDSLKAVYSKEAKFSTQVQELDQLSRQVLGTVGRIIEYDEQVQKSRTSRESAQKEAEGGAPVGELSLPSALPFDDKFKKGVERVDSEYKVRRIQPDGNCMFRSYSVGLLGGQYDKAQIVEHLQRMAQEGLIDKSALPVLCRSLENIQKSGKYEEVLRDKAISDAWVACCRQLVGRMILKILDTEEGGAKELKRIAKLMRGSRPELREIRDDKEVLRKYAEGISSMEKKWYGGELEANLLDQCLGTKSVELDVRQLSLEDSTVPHSDSPQAVFLFVRAGDHIDVAFPVSPQ